MQSRVKTIMFQRLLLASIVIFSLGLSCNQNGTKMGQSSRMTFTSGQFDQGRKDGHRDARAAWSDDSAAWLWLWMTAGDYRLGYKQGWIEGRAEVKMKQHQNEKDIK